MCYTKDKHDKILEDLVERLYNPVREYVFDRGEIDAYDDRGRTVLVFEVKSSKHPKSTRKAMFQLERNSRYLLEEQLYDRAISFIVYPNQIEYYQTFYN